MGSLSIFCILLPDCHAIYHPLGSMPYQVQSMTTAAHAAQAPVCMSRMSPPSTILHPFASTRSIRCHQQGTLGTRPGSPTFLPCLGSALCYLCLLVFHASQISTDMPLVACWSVAASLVAAKSCIAAALGMLWVMALPTEHMCDVSAWPHSHVWNGSHPFVACISTMHHALPAMKLSSPFTSLFKE